MSRESGQASSGSTHGDRAGAGSDGGQVPIEGTTLRADQFSGHALRTATSLRPLHPEPVAATLTVSVQPLATGPGPGGRRHCRLCAVSQPGRCP